MVSFSKRFYQRFERIFNIVSKDISIIVILLLIGQNMICLRSFVSKVV